MVNNLDIRTRHTALSITGLLDILIPIFKDIFVFLKSFIIIYALCTLIIRTSRSRSIENVAKNWISSGVQIVAYVYIGVIVSIALYELPINEESIFKLGLTLYYLYCINYICMLCSFILILNLNNENFLRFLNKLGSSESSDHEIIPIRYIVPKYFQTLTQDS